MEESSVQIAEGTGLASNTLYGKRPGRISSDLQELLNDNVIEMRYFSGERGRGGEVMRFRLTLPRNQQPRKESETGMQSHYQIKDEMTRLTESGRRLVAIIFTDIAGFTAMGQRDESLSLSLLEEHDKPVRPIFQRHSGRVVKTMGDSFLVEFQNALDAVGCAYDIPASTRESNVGLSVQKRIDLE